MKKLAENKILINQLKLDGGWLCLDFINTVNNRKTETYIEYLSSYDDLLRWTERVEMLTPNQIMVLRSIAAKDALKAGKIWIKVLEAREILYNLILSLVKQEFPSKITVAAYNKLLSHSLRKLQLNFAHPQKPEMEWKAKNDLELPLYPIIKSVYDLLTLNLIHRVKECSACGWLYFDKSKNNSRRWCNMQTCGSLNKSRNFYQRHRNQNLISKGLQKSR